MLAESVHQAAQGNYERAGAVVTASGRVHPHSGCIRSHRDAAQRDRLDPRRVLVLLNGDPAPAAGAHAPRASCA